jgi:hypothetical protein
MIPMKNIFQQCFLLLLISIQLVSCIKQDNCLPPRLEVSTKPVFAGDSIEFNITSDEGATFSWTGPNGFTSTEKNPVIRAATTDQAGEYQVIASLGGCATSVKVEVQVIMPPPCSPANNTISFVSNMTFSPAVMRINSVNRYELYATSAQGEFQVEFYSDFIKKGDFVYELSTTNSEPFNAFMQLDIGGVLANWQAVSGKLYVKWVNNKPVVTFCGANFSCLQDDYSRTGSGKISVF